MIEGELDNTVLGKVTGWMRFAGKKEKIMFNLEGDFHRDIRGTKIYFTGDARNYEPGAEEYISGFSERQRGKAGDITAGLYPYDYIRGSVYIEWYSRDNGRVVIELEQDQLQIIGKPIPANECEPISREEQDKNLTEFMTGLVQKFKAGGSKGK